ncbi:DNA mismatch repair protein [Patescibacteria group bacterium]|nr:DNA mismatch repair protein [Patescibacteria group bacterium]MBU1721496.1 DNA mismatch repair protein [Patescibacteria group bacterium]MBU1900932.1 DNA mismatch repair protein [Patescibacteria group bacterium]
MIRDDVQQLLDDKQRSLIAIYLDIQQLFERQYGPNTVVFMEVGSFFEVYGVDNDEIKIGKPKEMADILNLQLTRKNKTISHNDVKNPLLVGFPTATFDRYIERLVQEKKYTIVIIGQKGAPPKVTRHLDRILSPGVNVDYRQDHDDSFITSLLIDEHDGLYSVGYSAVDVTTGKTYLFETHSTKDDPTYALDEVFSLIQTNSTAEMLITCISKKISVQMIRQYLELEHDDTVHVNSKRSKVTYQNELFKQTYIIQSFLSPIEWLDLERKPLTSEALALLIEFIIDHDYHIVQKLNTPTHIDDSALMYLGNNPLEQLQIISRDPQEYTVFDLINHTKTSIGKRLLKNRLMNPIVSQKAIEHRYNLSDAVNTMTEEIEEPLTHVYDLERIARRMRIGRLHPFELNFLYDSMQAAEQLIKLLQTKELGHLLPNFIDTHTPLRQCIARTESTFDFDQTTKVDTNHIQGTLFKEGYNKELDALIARKEQLDTDLELIRSSLLDVLEEAIGKRDDQYVSIKQLDKEGHYICMTKSRYYLIEDLLKDKTVTVQNQVYSLHSFRKKIQTGIVKITAEIIERISEDIVVLQKKITALTKELFAEELLRLDEAYHDMLVQVTQGIAEIDVALSNAKMSTLFHFVRPEIIAADGDSRVLELYALRHPLVEVREDHGIYVPNDVILGDEALWSKEAYSTVLAKEAAKSVGGILLYGINSSGKSSLMKSIGIAIVLAQAGLYVPTSRMRFSLCKELFTRIVAKDNIEKGLSSFAVEMMELKNIFNRSSAHSLILGDEISHGTETLSAIAIVSATIARLAQKKSLFLFTTHLHQLHNLALLKDIQEVVSVHLAVHYDTKEDTLIFDRSLQSGSGSSVYGLEFAQSLHMDKAFLALATETRKALAHDYEDLELLTKKQTSKYNKKLFLTSCAICQKTVDDTHHISPQQEADEHGNIGHFHKDHKHNLLPICKDCHDKIHHGSLHVRGFVMTSKGLELSYEEVVKEN